MDRRTRLLSLVLTLVLTFPKFQVHAESQHQCDCAALSLEVQSKNESLEDWPQLSRYRDANKSVRLPKEGEQRVVFIGDSITELWGLPENWLFSKKPFLNRGISRQTSPQILLRFRADVIDLKPKVVVILAGTNDIAGITGPTTLKAIEDNLASMAQLSAANGIRVVFGSILPVLNRPDRPIDQIRRLNRWIRRYCYENHHGYADYFSALADEAGKLRPEFTDNGDGLHPNAKGYAKMTPVVSDAIKRAIKTK